MIRSLLFAAACALALTACATRGAAHPPAQTPALFLAATRVQEPISPSADVAPPAAPRARAPERRPSARKRGRRSAPVSRVRQANQSATREPTTEGYINAAQVYPWSEGALYRLYAAPEQVSDIALQPGETLVAVAAGDTARWVIGDTVSGAGASRRVHILVKPSANALRTNLVITTDRRVYHIQLESTSGASMASIGWTYPQDELLALSGSGAAAAAPVAVGLALEALNFGYRIEGDDPPWRPLRAFDDGRQVFIEFPPNLSTGEAPPLFVLGAGGSAELVNYRVRGRYYIVDRLFEAAELRLGEKHQQVVRIVRGGSSRKRRKGRGW